jgi:hypothetical protein
MMVLVVMISSFLAGRASLSRQLQEAEHKAIELERLQESTRAALEDLGHWVRRVQKTAQTNPKPETVEGK